MKKHIDLIKNTKLFFGMTEEDIISMLRCLSASKKEYKKGDYIYNAGDIVSKAAMVLEGVVHIERQDYWGNNSILSDVFPGELFGEVHAIMNDEPVAVNAIAAKSGTVLMLNMKKVFQTCTSMCPYHAKLIKNLIFVLASKDKELTDKMGYLSQRTIRDKLLTYLSDQSVRQGGAVFDISFNRQQLADFLAVDRSALSKELSKLKNEGIIEFKKNHFELKGGR